MRRNREIDVERELVARCLHGDNLAFGELFSLYRRPIYTICLSHVGDSSLAEDALQETFLRAFRSLRGFDPSRRFFPWLVSIASNRSIDLRQRRLRIEPLGLSPATEADHRDDVAANVVNHHRLMEALVELSPMQRRRLLLHDAAGWSLAELARFEGTTELAVRSSVFRARAALRAMLGVFSAMGAV